MYRVTRNEGFGDECKRRIMLGICAQRRLLRRLLSESAESPRLVARDYQQAFDQVDAIVGPVSPFPAFKLGEMVHDPVAMYLADIYTITGDQAGSVHERSVRQNRRRPAGGLADFDRPF